MGVSSENGYGLAAERELATERADYSAAGNPVVWVVDVLREQVEYVYRAADPEHPTVYRRGERAEAEPEFPEWSMPVDNLFA